MKQVFSGIAVLAGLGVSLSVSAAPETYHFDPNHTNITWHANHMGFSNPSGKFMQAEGTLTLDEENLANSKVEVTVKPSSVLTGLEKFDNHLKGKDFFEVEKFPEAKFVSDKVEVNGNTLKVHGSLTIRGVSKPVVLDATLNKVAPNPMSKKKTAGFSASTTVKRSEFGINYALPAVSDEVKVEIEVEATLAQE